MKRYLACLAWVLLVPALLAAQPESPERFLGYGLGTRFTPVARVEAYVRHVAERSDRVTLVPYGTTYEGRALVVAVVTSPRNHARLEAIRQDNLRRTGLLAGQPSTSLAEAPAIVWLSYNIHGNESVSSEAAMPVLYRLATAQGDTAQWLENAVVILDPCINPDGRNRYVEHFVQTVGAQPNADPLAREHVEPWPGGRFNHYLFDLNRDWAWQTQAESRARGALYAQWMPHVHADYHEMGPTQPYFFAPAAEPIHRIITPWQREFSELLGRRNAEVFQRNGWRYFTRESFDLLYPSYGDSWPTYQGAIGMTYEVGGGPAGGLAVAVGQRDTLTLGDRIARHEATSYATVEVAVRNRERLLREFAAYFQNPPEAVRGYLVRGGAPGSPAAVRVLALRTLLERLQIRSYAAAAGGKAVAVRTYGGNRINATGKAGDLWVPLAQPLGKLVQVLFEPNTELSDSLTYDITAWALPYAYGLEAYAATGVVASRPWAEEAPARQLDAKAYAYLVPWTGFPAVRMVAALHRAGIRVRSAEKPFEQNGTVYPAGTLVILRGDNPRLRDLDVRLAALAQQAGAGLVPTGSGRVQTGDDFGSGGVRELVAPRVALLAGEGLDPTAVGSVWHFFDQQLGYPLTVLPAQRLPRLSMTGLQAYQVLVLPDGRYADILTKRQLETLGDWVQAGGRLVVMDGALAAFSGKEGWGLVAVKGDSAPPAPEARLQPYAERERAQLTDAVVGAVYRLRLDASHPLAFGMNGEYYSLKINSDAYQYLTEGWNVGTIAPDSHVAGFVGGSIRKRLHNTLAAGVQPMGRGQVVYLADNPLFRGFWVNGFVLFGNAVFQVGN